MKIYLVRHGHAVKRKTWSGPDLLRPLTARGERHAHGVEATLRNAAIRRVWSSPSVRCHETVEPLAGDRSQQVELDARIGDDASVESALSLLDEVPNAPIVVCAGRSLIVDLLEALEVAHVDPDEVRCQKGSIWVLDRRGGRVAAADYIPPREVDAAVERSRRVGVLDIGSASMSLLVADVQHETQRVEPVLRERVALSFGASIGAIAPADAKAAARDARSMRAEARSVGCEELVTVATAGLRNAPNGDIVAEQIGDAVEMPVRMLTGPKEARLVYAATRSRLATPRERVISVDLGGGSLDFAWGTDDTTPVYEASEPLGVSRMRALHAHSDPMLGSDVEAIRAQLVERLAPHVERLGAETFRCFVTGGTVRALARLAQAGDSRSDIQGVRGLTISLDELGALRERLCHSSREQRMKMPTVSARRVDLLPTGAVILESLLEALELEQLTVCDWGLREGVLLSE